jgi:hypothetical protein
MQPVARCYTDYVIVTANNNNNNNNKQKCKCDYIQLFHISEREKSSMQLCDHIQLFHISKREKSSMQLLPEIFWSFGTKFYSPVYPKCKVVFNHAMKAYKRCRYSCCSFLTLAMDGDKWQHHALIALLLAENISTH